MTVIVVLLIVSGVSVSGCFPPSPPEIPTDVAGLKATDFQMISLNGFDPEDNLADRNDYAWSMEHFEPDGGAAAYLYVGTANDIYGISYQSIGPFLGLSDPRPLTSPPPEIRRYRDDLDPAIWETVFDYRDVESGLEYGMFGIRFLRQYRSPTDQVNRLYAGTFGNDARLWRSASGDPGSWEIVWQSGEPGSIRFIAEHNELLYLAFANEVPTDAERVGKIFVFDGDAVAPVVTDGFGDPNNQDVQSLISFNGWLYAGTKNESSGFQIWKLAGPGGQSGPVLVVDRGGPSWRNEAAITPCVYGGKLYYGSLISTIASFFGGGKAADIICINPDDTWETVVGPGSLSGLGSGFSQASNVYIWAMAEHNGWLYASTFDNTSSMFIGLEDINRAMKIMFRMREANYVERIWRAGADLYKTEDGLTWYPITLDGFGDVGNYGFRSMETVGDYLYIGTANPADGLEIWRGRSAD